jgi:hypothetical protein
MIRFSISEVSERKFAKSLHSIYDELFHSKSLGDIFRDFLGTGGRADTKRICGTTAAGEKARAARASRCEKKFSGCKT